MRQISLDEDDVPPRSDLVPCYVCGGWAQAPPDADEYADVEQACYECRRTRHDEL